MSEPAGYLRFPTLAGDALAFAAEDDVWLADLAARGPVRAWRLSDDRRRVAHLRFDPTGTRLAYTSRVDGAPDVRVVDAAGGPSRRLTWWASATTRVLGWTADGRVVAASAAAQPFRSRTWAYAVPLDAGPPQRLPYGPVTALATGPSGLTGAVGPVVVATGSGLDYAWWKRYRGGTASRLWVDAVGSGVFEPLAAGVGDGQLVHPMLVGERLAFCSDHEGHGNVYSCRLDGTDLRRHTDHDGAWARQASTDGTRVVYAAAGALWLLDDLAADSRPRRLDVRTFGPRAGRARRTLPGEEVAERVTAARPDATGRSSLVEVLGTVHRVSSREGPAGVVAATPGVRARLARFLGPPHEGEQRVVWVDDADGEDAVVISGSPPTRVGAARLGRVLDLAAAPDGSSVAVATHDGRLLLLDARADRGVDRDVDRGVDGGADRDVVRLIATTTDDAPRDLAFSPDSRWLAWSAPGPEPRASVRMARLGPSGGPDSSDGSDAAPEVIELIEVTGDRFTDSEPVFTLDGRYLALLSRRTFDPVYDEHVFDLPFPVAARPHLVPLVATTASPFDPEVGGRPETTRDDHQADHEARTDHAPDDGPAVPEVRVDPLGLGDRIVPAPVPAAWYSHLRAVDGGLVWLRADVHGVTGAGRARPDAPGARPVLERLDLATGRTLVLARDVDDVQVSGDGKRLLLRDGDDWRLVPAGAPVDDDDEGSGPAASVDLDLGLLSVVDDPPARWRQMLAEAWRLQRDHFWVDDLADVDWAAVWQRWSAVLDDIATDDDLLDVLWEMHGELGTSHAYALPPAAPAQARQRMGFLGADLAPRPDSAGVVRWVIERVLPGESSEPLARSPLAGPGVAVREGEVLLAVGGRDVDPVTGSGPLLAGTAGRPVELLLGPPDGETGGVPRRVVVVPLADEEPLRYQDWVAGRRAAVSAATGGRAGYLHVPDMMGAGWAQLHRDLRTEVTRDALVLDVRDNRGGHTSQLVVERLARRVLGWDVGRGWQPQTYPTDARRGPLVCLTNAEAGSDGDIVTAVVQQLGLGPVVGTRTWGGVVGIDGRYDLVDGTLVTQPRYAFWFPSQGWNVENHGVDPDVEVPFPPQAWAAGADPQLERAVELLLAALHAGPVARPPDVGTRPSRRAPALPPRPGGHP